MAQREMKALQEKDIKPGDFVSLPYRGGTRHGYVTKIAVTEKETPHPPKVIFVNDHNGKEVAHNPSTLTVDRDRSKRPDAEKEGTVAEEEASKKAKGHEE